MNSWHTAFRSCLAAAIVVTTLQAAAPLQFNSAIASTPRCGPRSRSKRKSPTSS